MEFSIGLDMPVISDDGEFGVVAVGIFIKICELTLDLTFGVICRREAESIRQCTDVRNDELTAHYGWRIFSVHRVSEIISSARTSFHSGCDGIRMIRETWGGGMFASALNPCVQFIFIEIE